MASHSPFDDLEAGPLRNELAPEIAAREKAAAERAAADAAALAARESAQPLQFTGDGREYFRIWIVNLLLTVATLGIYSAWAKVRKTRYFWQNTRLDGHVFDYHGNPLAILRGRILALLLLAAYSWGFDISFSVGLATIVVLLVAGPWLFMKAQQFKLRNSSWRGLRFDFRADRSSAYRIVLPPLALWFSSAVAGVLAFEQPIVAGLLGIATLLLFPWMHHRLKRFQHSFGAYGDVRGAFKPAAAAFYGVYGMGLLLALLAGVVSGIGAVGIGMAFGALAARLGGADVSTYAAWTSGLVAGLLLYTMLWPYFAARLQKIVWERTTFGPVRFRVEMKAWRLARIVFRNIALTLLTLGLYWPFAAVALARYRIQCTEVRTSAPLDELAAGVAAVAPAAMGEGAVDLFGLDIGL